ncbi:E4 ORF1 [Titi monkey adenovirus ECC-2011]|uniref:E4 ORF1 n=1 Tax=titi monkey adenovirus 1 TaxID=3123084 RepID=G0ZAK4_9ADEN|nr:E4 ORF1 [Titi monkey adenovirus ECC-2011]AEK98475.1 E4 ORF1 [Titi monkey adenovirus ECC-2011]
MIFMLLQILLSMPEVARSCIPAFCSGACWFCGASIFTPAEREHPQPVCGGRSGALQPRGRVENLLVNNGPFDYHGRAGEPVARLVLQGTSFPQVVEITEL